MVSKKQPAFTIVELLVVIVVIGILATITIISYSGIQQKAVVASLTSDLSNASKQLKMDQVINSAYPTTLAAANGGKGITTSSGTSYQYIYNNNANPQVFCITATNGSTSYKVTNNYTPAIGTCQTPGIVTDGLLLNLDAGNSVSYPGTGTAWTDLSGLGNHGTLVNGVGYSAGDGGTLVSDGVDDYVGLPSSLQNRAYSAISVSAWIKIINGVQQSGDWGSYIVHNGISYSVGNSIYALAINTTGTATWSWAGNYASMTTTTTYNDGIWHFLVGTWNGTDSVLYIDGALAKTAATAANLTGTSGDLDIGGARGLPTLRSFKGSISNVKIYNKVLNTTEITQDFNALKGRYGL